MDQRLARQILRIEDNREKQAVRVFREKIERHEAVLAKHKEFQEYRQEYECRLAYLRSSGQQISSEVLINYHQFKDSLDTVIVQHNEMLEKSRSEMDDSLEEWSDRHRHKKAFQELIDTQTRDSLKYQDKVDQKLVDEMMTSSRANLVMQ